MLSDLLHRLRALVRRKAVECELDEELQFHFDRQLEKHLRSGLDPTEALRRTRLMFGGIEQVKEGGRGARGVAVGESVLQDCGYALRMRRRFAAFAAMGVVLIGLRIGARPCLVGLVTAGRLGRGPCSNRLVYVRGV